jgi:hypothetical protein
LLDWCWWYNYYFKKKRTKEFGLIIILRYLPSLFLDDCSRWGMIGAGVDGGAWGTIGVCLIVSFDCICCCGVDISFEEVDDSNCLINCSIVSRTSCEFRPVKFLIVDDNAPPW